MINNLNQIIPLLKFEEGIFYYLQVLQRKKDNPEMSCQTKQRYFKFIRSQKELETYTQEAIEISNLYNARTYISLTPRSFEKLSLEVLIELSKRIKNKDYNNNFKIFEKLALLPECAKKDGKLWMIDYDNQKLSVSNFIELLFFKYKIHVESLIQTVNGWHVIIKPFNLTILGEKVDQDYNYKLQEGYEFCIRFDCNTLLYCGEAKSL